MSKALDLFTSFPRRHNCAQAVAAGASREDLVPQMAACGGGRAPEGLCGALYAATLCDPQRKQAILDAFRAANGDITCKELKENGVPCTKCVETAAALLAK